MDEFHRNYFGSGLPLLGNEMGIFGKYISRERGVSLNLEDSLEFLSYNQINITFQIDRPKHFKLNFSLGNYARTFSRVIQGLNGPESHDETFEYVEHYMDSDVALLNRIGFDISCNGLVESV